VNAESQTIPEDSAQAAETRQKQSVSTENHVQKDSGKGDESKPDVEPDAKNSTSPPKSETTADKPADADTAAEARQGAAAADPNKQTAGKSLEAVQEAAINKGISVAIEPAKSPEPRTSGDTRAAETPSPPGAGDKKLARIPPDASSPQGAPTDTKKGANASANNSPSKANKDLVDIVQDDIKLTGNEEETLVHGSESTVDRAVVKELDRPDEHSRQEVKSHTSPSEEKASVGAPAEAALPSLAPSASRERAAAAPAGTAELKPGEQIYTGPEQAEQALGAVSGPQQVAPEAEPMDVDASGVFRVEDGQEGVEVQGTRSGRPYSYEEAMNVVNKRLEELLTQYSVTSTDASSGGTGLRNFALKLCDLAIEVGGTTEKLSVEKIRSQILAGADVDVSLDEQGVRRELSMVLTKFPRSTWRYLDMLPDELRALFGMYPRPDVEMTETRASDRRGRRKVVRDRFISSCSQLSRESFLDRPAFGRSPDTTGTNISISASNREASPEYFDIADAVMEAPYLRERADTESCITAKIGNVLDVDGDVQNIAAAKEKLRIIRSRRETPPPRQEDEFVITNFDCYVDDNIIGDDHAQELLKQATGVVLSHEGFVKSSQLCVEVAAELTADFISRMGRALAANRSEHPRLRSSRQANGVKRKNGMSHRGPRSVSVAQLVATAGFRGGFDELVTYKNHDIGAVASAVHEAEARLKHKVPNWQKYVAAAESGRVRLQNYDCDRMTELERIFGLFPDGVRADLFGDLDVHLSRSLAEKFISNIWSK